MDLLPPIIDYFRSGDAVTADAVDLVGGFAKVFPSETASVIASQAEVMAMAISNRSLMPHLFASLFKLLFHSGAFDLCSCLISNSMFFPGVGCNLPSNRPVNAEAQYLLEIFPHLSLTQDKPLTVIYDGLESWLRGIPGGWPWALENLDVFLRLVFQTVDQGPQAVLLKLIEQLIQESPAHRKKVIGSLRKFFASDFEFPRGCSRWNYNPDHYSRSSSFCGLNKVEGTCFLNAILQQLFHLPPFRLLTVAWRGEARRESLPFGQLFIDLQFTRQRFCDPRRFIEAWSEEGERLIDPTGQQDVSELFGRFLRRMPTELCGLFRGLMAERLDGVTVDYSVTELQPFWVLDLEVGGIKGLVPAMGEWLRAEMIEHFDVDGFDTRVSNTLSDRRAASGSCNSPPAVSI
jgi:hypothetical protein